MIAANDLPRRLAEIVDDFSLAEGQEKLELLLQYAESLPALPDRLKAHPEKMESVPECMTPVFVAMEANGPGIVFHFEVPEESPTVRGYAAIMAEGLNGASPEQVLSIPSDFYIKMGLQSVLSMQRMSGFAGMVAHLKRLALEKIASSS